MLIHVGIGKSGTTALQTLVFDKHPKILNFGKPNDSDPAYRAFYDALTDGLAPNDSGAVSDYLQGMERRARSEGKVAVLSDEMLTVQVSMLPGIVMRLKEAMPDAHILITTRNQVDAIASYYANHGRVLKTAPKPYHGRHVSFRDWWDFAKANWQSGYLGSLCYWDIARLYIDAFGPSNVHVLQFEERLRAPEVFAGKLAPLMSLSTAQYLAVADQGAQANPRDSARLVRYHKFRRHLPALGLSKWLPGHATLVRFVDGRLRKGKAYTEPLPAGIVSEITALYGEQNQSLERVFGLELAGYGYPVAAGAGNESLTDMAAKLRAYEQAKRRAA